MKIFARLGAAFAAALLVTVPATGLAEEQIPLSAYGALPDVEKAAISASGKHIAVLLTVNGVRQLYFINSEMKLIRNMTVGDLKVRSFEWIGDDKILLTTSQTQGMMGFTVDKYEMRLAQIVPVTTAEEPEVVFSNVNNLLDAVFGNYGLRNVGGKYIANFGALRLKSVKTNSNLTDFRFDHGRPYLYSVDTTDNSPRPLARAAREGFERDWVLDRNGEVAATLDVSVIDGDWTLRGPTEAIIASGNQQAARVGLLGLGYDGTSVLYYERDENNISRWYELSLAGGQPKPFLREKDVDGLYFDELTGHLLGYLDAREGPVFNNPDFQTAANRIRKAFGGSEMRMVDWSDDFSKFIVRTSGNGDSGSWFVVDLSNGSANAFAYERMALGAKQVGPISTVTYTARDGLEMDGILTLPPGLEAKNLPVIMLPHGGPHSQDRPEFDWWAQAFASRGYAVFQPNFRGSTNRSQQFKLAGYGEWGRKMQTDITDGLAMLAEKGIVDPSRACIVGASYGGYAALAGVTIEQGIYRCAVAVAPVSDIKAMYSEDYRATGRDQMTKASLLEQLGPREGWDEVSPRRLADRADAPIMLIHGVDDTVVPYSHSSIMADKLKDAGKPYELVKLEGEDHWLSLSETRLKMLEAAVGFVEKHNPAD